MDIGSSYMEDPSSKEIIKLSYQPPFDWQNCLSFHQSHSLGDYQSIRGDCYTRILNPSTTKPRNRPEYFLPPFLMVVNDSANNQLLCRIRDGDSQQREDIVRRVRHMFDLDADPQQLRKHFASQPILADLINKYPGLRVCRHFDPLEGVLSTILGQLISVKQAANLCRQVVTAYGTRLAHPVTARPVQVFPSLTTLANADFATIGTTQGRREALIAVLAELASGRLSLQLDQDVSIFKAKLLEIKGIGPWTAEYLGLRALGDLDSFPATDLILKRALERHPQLRNNLNRLSPLRAYAAIYLWRHYAEQLTRPSRPTPNHGADPQVIFKPKPKP